MFPKLDGSTEAALRASIKRFGVIVPIVIDQHGEILDGHHRSRLAGELGMECPTQALQVSDEDEGRLIALTLNADRRHLTTEQRREIVASLRSEGHSIRAIANAHGVALATVVKDLEKTGVQGRTPVQTQGLDGKQYPSKRRRGPRSNPRARFDIETQGQRERADGQLRRLVTGLSEINGLCRGLQSIDYGMASAACKPGEMEQWAVMAGKLSTALRILRTELEGVCHAPEAQQDYLSASN